MRRGRCEREGGTVIDKARFQDQVRKLKRLIREDSTVRARFDADGDGEISGAEWERAVATLRRQMEQREAQSPGAAMAAYEAMRANEASPAGGSGLDSCAEVVVKQLVERREVFLGYETSNRYVFTDRSTGRELGGADEDSGGFGGFMSRQFLGPARPLNLSITDTTRGVGMEGRRPFRLFAFIQPPTLTLTGTGGPLGTVRRIWPLVIRRRYEVRTGNGAGPGLLIDGTLLHPWTFPVKKRGRQVACILKKWSGIGREMFTDADTFLVRFEDPALSTDERRLLLAAALAIDFDFFEKKPRN
jgi:hypothetical protein